MPTQQKKVLADEQLPSGVSPHLTQYRVNAGDLASVVTVEKQAVLTLDLTGQLILSPDTLCSLPLPPSEATSVQHPTTE